MASGADSTAGHQIFSQIDFHSLGAILSNIALVSLGAAITIFVLTVTLLGRAAKLAKEKRAETEQKSKEEFDRGIELLRKKIQRATPDDIPGLSEQIDDLQAKKDYTEDRIKEIERKYNALGLKESVLVPGGLLFTSLIFGNWLIVIIQDKIWQFASLCLALILLSFGIRKIVLTLQAVQEVALNADVYQLEQLRNAMTEALKTVEGEKEPRPIVVFDETPPFVFKSNAEAQIAFQVDLELPGNKEARNVDVWFLSSPEIELLGDPRYEGPFEQAPTYMIPGANTVVYKFGYVKKYTRAPGAIKIKTTVAGSFRLLHKVNCDNHVESVGTDREVGIIVKD